MVRAHSAGGKEDEVVTAKLLTDHERRGLDIAWHLLERENLVGAQSERDERACSAAMGRIYALLRLDEQRRERARAR